MWPFVTLSTSVFAAIGCNGHNLDSILFVLYNIYNNLSYNTYTDLNIVWISVVVFLWAGFHYVCGTMIPVCYNYCLFYMMATNALDEGGCIHFIIVAVIIAP